MIKKLTFALFTILGSASALAGGPANVPLPIASGIDLMAPHQEGSWSFGVQANYFQPNNDFNYAVGNKGVTDQFNNQMNQARTYAVNADNDWGWGADITYHFPGEGRDVTLAFTQLNTSDSNSVNKDDAGLTTLNATGMTTFNATGAMLNATEMAAFNNFDYDSASADVNTNYDAVDLTFGQVITAGSRITLHPFAGLRYAYIDYKATGAYQATFFNPKISPVDEPAGDLTERDSQTLKSTFSGAGPRLGSDAAVNLGSGFSLRGTLGVSLLVGSMDIDADYSRAEYNLQNTQLNGGEVDHAVDSNTRVVPEADAKLAAMYHADFNNGYGMGFEVGYQVTNYFNAIQNNTVSTVDTSTEYTDFFMQGPYARIQLDVA